MKAYIELGTTPCEEDCAQVGDEDYRERALAESKRFIALLRKTLGKEPPGARLAIKWFDHDFGRYCEVVCWYDTDDEETRQYALSCEDSSPARWGGERIRR